MIAAITLRLLDPFGTGKLVLFQVTYDKVTLDRQIPVPSEKHLIHFSQDWHAYELIFFLLLGVFGVRRHLLPSRF
jgi:chloride channel 3/4/5